LLRMVSIARRNAVSRPFRQIAGKVAHVADLGGYTVAEMVVGLTVVGGMIGMTFQALSVRAPTIEGTTSSRAGESLDLLGPDRPLIASGAILVHADRDSVTLREPWARGVVCALPGEDLLDLVFPFDAGRRLLDTHRGRVVVKVGMTEDQLWRRAIPAKAVGAASTRCNGFALPAGEERRRVTVSGLSGPERTMLTVGGAVYLYQQTTYRRGDFGGIHGVRLAPDATRGANDPDVAGAHGERSGGPGQVWAPGRSRLVLLVEATNRGEAGEYAIRLDTVRIGLTSRY